MILPTQFVFLALAFTSSVYCVGSMIYPVYVSTCFQTNDNTVHLNFLYVFAQFVKKLFDAMGSLYAPTTTRRAS